MFQVIVWVEVGPLDKIHRVHMCSRRRGEQPRFTGANFSRGRFFSSNGAKNRHYSFSRKTPSSNSNSKLHNSSTLLWQNGRKTATLLKKCGASKIADIKTLDSFFLIITFQNDGFCTMNFKPPQTQSLASILWYRWMYRPMASSALRCID